MLMVWILLVHSSKMKTVLQYQKKLTALSYSDLSLRKKKTILTATAYKVSFIIRVVLVVVINKLLRKLLGNFKEIQKSVKYSVFC